jgi:hypothetical protein
MPLKDPIARAAYQKAYAQKNRIKAYERIKEWRAANPYKPGLPPTIEIINESDSIIVCFASSGLVVARDTTS